MTPRPLVFSLLWIAAGALAESAGAASLAADAAHGTACAQPGQQAAGPEGQCEADLWPTPTSVASDDSWRGALGGLVLSVTVFGLLGAAAASRRARERTQDLGMTAIRLPEPPVPGAQERLQELLRERAALQAELRAVGVEVDTTAHGPAQQVSRAA